MENLTFVIYIEDSGITFDVFAKDFLWILYIVKSNLSNLMQPPCH